MKIANILTIIIVVIVNLWSGTAVASAPRADNVVPGSIHLWREQGRFVFYADITAGTAVCNPSDPNRWVVSLSDPFADEIMKLVLLSSTTKRPLFVHGNGTCEPGTNGNYIAVIYVADP